ncbi:MAG: hypothetical protein OQK35_08600 [Alphaproteobacteria bacterium]|nr:hypothetical protein [Rhodospirillales bacterium]MCW9046379.1 hypothetical protein [Alphaproteobacteria bacterium]
MTTPSLNMEALTQACNSTVPGQDITPLLEAINNTIPGYEFHLTFTEKDWYRVGGIVTTDGERIAENLEEWVEVTTDGNVMDLVAEYGDESYCATALSGKTHFLSAPTGDKDLEFLQIEVEEVQETMDRELFDPNNIPDTLEDIIDPLNFIEIEHKPISSPKYIFKNAICFSDITTELTSEYSGDPRFKRFLEEWERSSAGKNTEFYKHWAIEILPILRDVGEHRHEVKLFSPHADAIHAYDMSGMSKSGPIVQMLNSLDKESGFPMAWYFLMLTKKFMSYAMVKSINEEIRWSREDFAFLADKDRQLLENWVEDPYNL